MNAIQWVERVKDAKGIPSDYAVAKLLGVARSTISNYRNNADCCLDLPVVMRVAEALEISSVSVALDQVIERSRDPATQTRLRADARRAGIYCKPPPGAPKSIAARAHLQGAGASFH